MFQNPFIRSFGQFPGRRQACQRTDNLRIYIHQPSQYVSEILRPDQVSKFYGKNRVGMSILFVLEKRIENRRSERPRVNGESCSMAFNSDRNAAGQPLPSNQSIDVESWKSLMQESIAFILFLFYITSQNQIIRFFTNPFTGAKIPDNALPYCTPKQQNFRQYLGNESAPLPKLFYLVSSILFAFPTFLFCTSNCLLIFRSWSQD